MNLRKYLHGIRDYDVDDVLGAVGLQKRSGHDWVFPMLAGLGAGLAIGAGLAFFLTPYRGAEAREKVRKGAADATSAIKDKVQPILGKIGHHDPAEPVVATEEHGEQTPNRSY